MRPHTISQYGSELVGIEVWGPSGPADPDGTVLVSILNIDSNVWVVLDGVATRDGLGLFSYVVGPPLTQTKGHYQVLWEYQMSGEDRDFTYDFDIVDPQPYWDALTSDEKLIVDSVYFRVSDGYDSTIGGPYLWEMPQANFGYNGIARIMTISAMTYINFGRWPAFLPPFTVGGQGNPFPAAWGGLLEKACVTPDTPVLRADLTWVPAGDIQVGDELVAFDDDPMGKFRTAVALANEPLVRECFEIETPKGIVVATGDHPWVTREYRWSRGERLTPGFNSATRRRWTETRDLVPGKHFILGIGEPWEEDRSYEAGYLAGQFDGEGCLTTTPGSPARLYYTQNPGAALDRVTELLKDRQFDLTVEGRDRVRHVRVMGGLSETMRLLGSVRPIRLLGQQNLRSVWEGRSMRAKSVQEVPVLSVRPVGLREVAGIETSTGTIITAGLLSHNTFVELLKHLRRSYVEQPIAANIGTGRLDRRDYLDRWGIILNDEVKELDTMLAMLKRTYATGIRSRALLVAGGIFPIAYLDPARPRWPYVATRF